MGSLNDIVDVAGASPRFFFGEGQAGKAVLDALDGLQDGVEITTLTGEPGLGKTTVLGEVSAVASGAAAVATVLFAKLDHDAFLQVVCAKFGTRGGANPGAALRRRLRALKARGRTAVLVIDDADELDGDSLLRLLDEARDPHTEESLLRMVITGQPTFEHRLRAPENAALAARIGLSLRLHPYPADEARAFVRAWLRAAGDLPFDDVEPSAMDRLIYRGGGAPARLNALCIHLLREAARLGLTRVAFQMVEDAAREIGVRGFDATPEQRAIAGETAKPLEPSDAIERPRRRLTEPAEDLEPTSSGVFVAASERGFLRWPSWLRSDAS